MRIFINEQPHEVDHGASVRKALAEFDATVAATVAEGRAYVTDGVGRRLDPASPLRGGAILRVITSAPRNSQGESPA